LLNDLDRELERRGHQFCRYADDCNVYLSSRAAAEHAMNQITQFVEGKLRLKVNREKSACARPRRMAFNGRGPWWNAGASAMNLAFPKSYFDARGLVSLVDLGRRFQSQS
jgi:RNA-directed DNA polymerase